MSVILGFWKIRGVAQAARYLLEYTGVKYSNKMFEMGESPEFDRSKWSSVQKLVGFESEFAVLPYLIDG